MGSDYGGIGAAGMIVAKAADDRVRELTVLLERALPVLRSGVHRDPTLADDVESALTGALGRVR